MSNPDFNFFSAIFPSTTDMINSFDWSISDAIDINSISFSKRNKPFLRFLKTFRDAKVFSGGSTEQITHLLNVLQQSIRYFSSDHIRMRETINVREAEINSLHQQIRNLKSQGSNLPGNDIYFCPICMNGFDSYHTVDMHIEIQHPTLAEKWKEIRHPTISQPKSTIPSTTTADVQPGTKKITQNDVINAVGEQMHKKLQENAKTYQDLKNEMNARFQEFVDLLNANDYSSYSSYYTIERPPPQVQNQTQQPNQSNEKIKKRRRHSHSRSSSQHHSESQTPTYSNDSLSNNSYSKHTDINDYLTDYSTTGTYSTTNGQSEISSSINISYSNE